MPGQPKTKAMIKQLDEIGEERLFEDLMLGMTATQMKKKWKIGNRSFYKWLTLSEGRKYRYDKARKAGADALAEETLAIADDPNLTPEEVKLASLKIDTRKWLASRINSENWGSKNDPTVNISIADMHMEALKAIRPVIEGNTVKEVEVKDDD